MAQWLEDAERLGGPGTYSERHRRKGFAVDKLRVNAIGTGEFGLAALL